MDIKNNRKLNDLNNAIYDLARIVPDGDLLARTDPSEFMRAVRKMILDRDDKIRELIFQLKTEG